MPSELHCLTILSNKIRDGPDILIIITNKIFNKDFKKCDSNIKCQVPSEQHCLTARYTTHTMEIIRRPKIRENAAHIVHLPNDHAPVGVKGHSAGTLQPNTNTIGDFMYIFRS